MSQSHVSRRQAIQAGAFVGAALVTGGPAAGQTEDTAPSGDAQLLDPRDRYPKPPFKQQKQAPPGLARDMQPPPDHGEHSYKGTGRLTGRKALVTGGDSGIGRAAVIAFAREGADVAIGYLPVEEPDAQDVKRIVEAAGRRCLLLPGDIRDEHFCQTLVAKAVTGLGGLDILVNNASHHVVQASLAELTTEQFDATFKTNVYAMFWITKAAVPHIPPGGCIINTTSAVAFQPLAHELDYGQTKASIVAFTKGLAQQLISKGIRVNAVAPGPFWTPLQATAEQSPDNLVEVGKWMPLGRPGQPAELAGTYVLLASADSTYTTGEVFGGAGGNMPY